MSDLSDFLLARIAEDEMVAQGIAGAHQSEDWDAYISSAGFYDGPAYVFAGRIDPVRVLAECDAKRRIIELADEVVTLEVALDAEFGPMTSAVGDPSDRLLYALALPYADHPDYRDEWRQ